jgi:NADP-dependent 3-hydroxy acid dehydrogenase YdfG
MFRFLSKGLGGFWTACRDTEKGRQAFAQLKRSIEVLSLDLSNLHNVREFVKQWKERNQKIDILINNAGIMVRTWVQRTTLLVCHIFLMDN